MDQNRKTSAPADTPARTPAVSDTAGAVGLIAAVVVLIAGFVLGLCFFLRPDVSETEKRTLTPFPALSWDGFISGEWTEQVSLWYADTFPGREAWVSAWKRFEGLFGFGARAEIGTGDDVPDTMGDPDDTSGPVETDDPAIPIHTDPTGEQIDGYYLAGDTAYELYYFSESAARRYASLINRAAEKLSGQAEVYDAVIPLSYSFYLDQKTRLSLDAADGQRVMSYVYSGLKNVKTVDVYSALSAHKDEYIFFRTDHHWTATGAYYVYESFCAGAGIAPTPLSSYQHLTFGGFLGTLYAHTGQPAALAAHPDTVDAYVPIGTNRMTILRRDGTEADYYPVVQTRTDDFYQAAASKYNCFIAGDNPLTTIHNENISGAGKGKSIVLVKESFGNALAPFLVDSYEYVYIIDYRYYNGDLAGFVASHDVGTVLFLNNVVAVTAGARLNEMEQLIGK